MVPSLLPRAVFAVLCAFLPCQQQAAAVAEATDLHGRIEEHEGLRILRTWGTPQQRGYAHGKLLGHEIARAMAGEFGARFGRRQPLLTMARQALPRLIEYPDDVQAEIAAVYAGLCDAGASRRIDEIDRDFDLDDLRIANALDVFGLMGCSGFAVHGDQVEGGGVLTGRNFDWPCTGAHLVDQTIVMVQHRDDGAVAFVTWPGYVGAVTGINDSGVAVYLHVGTGAITVSPEPSSWPTAIAARQILVEARGTDAAVVFARAQDLLGYTSPPAGYLTRVVMPVVPAGGSPEGLFETDSEKVVRAPMAGASVVCNHWLGRKDGRGASEDSLDREKAVRRCLDDCFGGGDHRVDVQEGWQMLQKVQRGGSRGFGTLHSLVYRHEPWCFELALAELKDGKIVAAPASARRYRLPRSALFPAKVPGTAPR